MILGFGTGSLYKLVDPASKEVIEVIKKTGSTAIELCGVLKKRFDESEEHNFFNFDSEDFEGFEYVSLHAPVDTTYNNDFETKRLLDTIDGLCKRLPITLVVFHPNNVKDFSVFDGYDFPIAFENMDLRKGTMLQPEEFKEIFSNPRYGFVLDVTHAYTNDQTGGLARELINHYRPKIKQIHCSGYFVHGEDEQQHFPAHLESKYWGREENLPHHTILSDVIEEFPIIIESVLPDDIEEKLNPLTKEFAFIRNYILDKKES